MERFAPWLYLYGVCMLTCMQANLYVCTSLCVCVCVFTHMHVWQAEVVFGCLPQSLSTLTH